MYDLLGVWIYSLLYHGRLLLYRLLGYKYSALLWLLQLLLRNLADNLLRLVGLLLKYVDHLRLLLLDLAWLDQIALVIVEEFCFHGFWLLLLLLLIIRIIIIRRSSIINIIVFIIFLVVFIPIIMSVIFIMGSGSRSPSVVIFFPVSVMVEGVLFMVLIIIIFI